MNSAFSELARNGIPIDGLIAAIFRLLPLLVLFPLPGLDRLPVTVRVFFCLTLALCVAGNLPASASQTGMTAWLLHFLLGLALALGAHAVFAGIHTGAHLIDTQAGTHAAGIFNPSQGGSGVFAELIVLATAISVLLSDAFLLLLGQLLAFPLPALAPDQAGVALDECLRAFATHMAAGFLLTLPIVAGLWLMDVLAAASSRLLPQANIYFLFLPIKTLFATLLLLASSTAILMASNRLVAEALVN